MQGHAQTHSHVFLGEGHEANERKTWAVIILCSVMMVVEIVGGASFNSLALIADGLHMSTHAGAMLIAALAYTYARRHATDNRFVFGTGKLGDLAGFTSAIVLAVVALFIGYEAIERLIDPLPIAFNEAIPIAVVGLGVNVVSAWLLSGNHHGHTHGVGHSHGPGHSHGGTGDSHGNGDDHARHTDRVGQALDSAEYREATAADLRVPFRAGAQQPTTHGHDHGIGDAHQAQGHTHSLGHVHGDYPTTAAQATLRDNSIRSAYVHVIADAFVSVLAITGLILARQYGWLWMDPVAGIIGAVVIANWAVTLMRDTAGVLLDVCPDEITRERVRKTIESDGDQVVDLHVWRLGPGHLAAVVAIATTQPRDASFYRRRLSSFACLSHITVEVTRAPIA